MPIDSPSVESSIEDSDSDENQTEILLNNSKNEEKMRIFLERNYSALKSIFLDGNFQNDKHNRGSLTLSPMGSNPTDFLWGGGICLPYVSRELKVLWLRFLAGIMPRLSTFKKYPTYPQVT